MNWLQIAINTSKQHVEQAEDCLLSAGAQTVTLTDAEDQPILEPGVDETPIWNEVVVTGLFDDPEREQDILIQLRHCLDDILYRSASEILPDQNWTRAWMDHYHEMRFGDRLRVCPLHLEPSDGDAINLRLDPGLAFGTGTHPTTSLCLQWLDVNITQQQTLLDYGCGSGILAIAACMLGVEHADAVDIDPQALLATHDNAANNGVSGQITTWLPEDYKEDHADSCYDIVVANILSGPLAELAPTLAAHCRIGGDIVLSGILKEQAEAVREVYADFFDMDATCVEEDWALLHGVRC